jgi:hypothetical protein
MLFYKDGKEQGRLGIIAVEMERSKGAIPRWVPLYFPYSGDAHAKKQLLGLRFAHPIEKQDDETADALAVAEAKAKKQQEEHQLLQALRATIGAVDKATDELGQLEAMAKAEPNTAATLQEVMEAKTAAKKAAEKQLAAVLEIIGGAGRLGVSARPSVPAREPFLGDPFLDPSRDGTRSPRTGGCRNRRWRSPD